MSEVDSVLSKLMLSVDKDDNNSSNLVPLIASLQATLKANVKEVVREGKAGYERPRLSTSSQSKSSSLTSENSPGTPATKMKDPFEGINIREEDDCPPVHARPFRPMKFQQQLARRNDSGTFTGSFDHGYDETGNYSPAISTNKVNLPWKIRAARKRSVKHHTTGMTKEELSQIKQSIQDSAAKCELL